MNWLEIAVFALLLLGFMLIGYVAGFIHAIWMDAFTMSWRSREKRWREEHGDPDDPTGGYLP